MNFGHSIKLASFVRISMHKIVMTSHHKNQERAHQNKKMHTYSFGLSTLGRCFSLCDDDLFACSLVLFIRTFCRHMPKSQSTNARLIGMRSEKPRQRTQLKMDVNQRQSNFRLVYFMCQTLVDKRAKSNGNNPY